ncbi:Uncharacterised protein [Mycobacteroides abscessus subsp. massiliense]|nr:Uncharacterised protein [Mycobacteroides abscessus subsp. massiliense]
MAQMVGAELQLETVRGVALRRIHHPGVIDEQIDLWVLITQLFSSRTDIREGR